MSSVIAIGVLTVNAAPNAPSFASRLRLTGRSWAGLSATIRILMTGGSATTRPDQVRALGPSPLRARPVDLAKPAEEAC